MSPALLKQLKAAKSNEQAFDLLAGAMVKLEDPAKRAALAQATLGSAELGALFSKGPNGIKELRDRYFELAGSQEGAAKAAGETDDAMKDFKAATDGVKAALVQGLAPALTVIVKQLRDWFKENRERIAEWAKSLGEKLPGAVAKLVDVFKGIVNFIRPFVDSGTKLKILAGVLAAVIAGPLVASVYSLGVALLTTPVGWIVAGLAAIAAAALILITDWGGVRTFFVDLWDTLGEKFGIARDIVAFTLAPFIYIPAKIIANWDSISSFFVNLWDGITGVFEKAWNFIKGIIDKVVGAVDTVKGAVSDVIDFVNPFSSDDDYKGVTPVSDVTNKIIADLQAKQQAAAARVSVDFANAPRGTRVSTDPKSTADIDLSVGYQMGGL
ncbi:MAG TPA: hypothetical protein VNA66_05550 [Gammaproteobacteria bacterium]|nr:hypothetical protein [Gammaproteobacteria bacterium]